VKGRPRPSERPRRARGLFARAVFAGTLASAASVGAAPAKNCEPWPGEPSPLPALNDPDPMRKEWAELRVKELAQWAERSEKNDPLRARQMWRRLLCIDPANQTALQGVLRALPVAVHRPDLVDQPPIAEQASDPFAALDAPLGLATNTRVATREAESQSEFRALRREVGALEEKVRSAQFEQVVARVPALRARLSRAPAGGTRTSLIAQAEILAATAEIALGRTDAADASLRRALAADPTLTLDPATTAPKVLRALASARGEVQ
jgi:hypothetical protein